MRKRADVLLVERGLCESRSRAQRLILAGQVRTGPDAVVQKPSDLLPPDVELTVAQPCPYVSRAAYKLLPAIDRVGLDLAGAVVLDVGASTGGFTDLALQRGAARVYAVDVGHGQLHAKLQHHPRVVSLERVNARSLAATEVPEPVDVLTVDVSFISVRKVLPAAARLLRPHGWAFVLVKPQFEAEAREVGKGGIVRHRVVQDRCVSEVTRFAVAELGWEAVGTVESPFGGGSVNREIMAVFTTGESGAGSPSQLRASRPLPSTD